MVTIADALKLLEAGFSVEDIRAMDKPPKEEAPEKKPEQKPEQKQEQKQEQKPEQKPEQNSDPRIDALAESVEKLVNIVGKLPFNFSMGDFEKDNDADAILASIINPTSKRGENK